MSDEEYKGPPVACGPETVRAVRVRASRFIERRTGQLYDEAVADWASQGGGLFPDRADARRQAVEEIEVLCRGLGRWVAVPPESLPHGRPGSRPNPFHRNR